MANRTPLTVHGAKLLAEELERLIKIERPRIINAISEARAHGDLKENAEYHAAREQQGFTEARIRHIESILSNAQIIDITTIENDGRIIFGATVHLSNTETSEELRYQIVGEDEADLKHHKISITSPIARALIGKYESDTILVQTPGGKVEFEIIGVDYV